MLYSSREIISKDYDVVVIGSGLAGMTAANKLAKDGHSVLLLEAHNKLGGFATWFYRDQKKHVFDISLHGFPYGMVKTCRKYWSKEIADHIVQLKDVRFINPQYNITSTFTKEDFTKKLISEFSIEEKVVHEFYQFIESMNFYDGQAMTNRELFERFFPGRNDVVRFLMEPIVYANGSTLDDPAITYGIVFSNFMKKGVYTFKGGTDHIIRMMQQELLNNGVDIKKQAKVEKIHLAHSKIYGVEHKGHIIRCKAIVSNANLYSTIFNMCGEEYFTQDFITKAKAVRMNSSSCQVYMGLRTGEKIDYVGDLIFTSTHPEFDTEKLLAKDITSRTYSIYYPEGRPYDEFPRYAIVSSTNSHWKDWAELDEASYARDKQRMIDETLSAVEKIIPGIREKIDFVEAATPRTVNRYTHHRFGSSFGTKFEGLEVSMNLHHQVPGLYHAGSVGIIMSGWLGAANYGVIQANNVESYLATLQSMPNYQQEQPHV